MIISVIMFIYVCMCNQVIICNKKHMLVPYIVSISTLITNTFTYYQQYNIYKNNNINI